MRTNYYICEQFVVESGRVSVNTGALLGEEMLVFSRLQNDTRILEHLGSIQIIIKNVLMHFIFTIDLHSGSIQTAVRVCSNRQEERTSTTSQRRHDTI